MSPRSECPFYLEGCLLRWCMAPFLQTDVEPSHTFVIFYNLGALPRIVYNLVICRRTGSMYCLRHHSSGDNMCPCFSSKFAIEEPRLFLQWPEASDLAEKSCGTVWYLSCMPSIHSHCWTWYSMLVFVIYQTRQKLFTFSLDVPLQSQQLLKAEF